MSGRKKKGGSIMERSAVLFAGQALNSVLGVSSRFGVNGGELEGIAAKMLMGSGGNARIEAGDAGEGFNDPEPITLGDDVEAEQDEGAERLVMRVVEVEDKHDEFGKFFNVFLIKCRYGNTVWSLKKRFSQFHRFDLDLRANVANTLGVALPAFPRKTLFNSGQNPAQIDQRRRQLDVYVTELTRLVAQGPSTGPVEDAKEEARNIAVMHLSQAVYTLVEMPSQMFSDAKVRKEEYLDGYDDPVIVGCEDYEEKDAEPVHSPELIKAWAEISKVSGQLDDAKMRSQSHAALKLKLSKELGAMTEDMQRLEDELVGAAARVGEVLEGPGFCRDDAEEVLEMRRRLQGSREQELAMLARAPKQAGALGALALGGLRNLLGAAARPGSGPPLAYLPGTPSGATLEEVEEQARRLMVDWRAEAKFGKMGEPPLAFGDGEQMRSMKALAGELVLDNVQLWRGVVRLVGAGERVGQILDNLNIQSSIPRP
ncbi:hypothetical protein T484DRAFT_2017222, partial [Baffinella frigidus]